MRLISATFPQNIYVFSQEAQNTRMWVESRAFASSPKIRELEIQEGTYTGPELALELQCRLRQLDTKVLKTAQVLFDKVSLRFWFNFGDVPVSFRFDMQNDYVPPNSLTGFPSGSGSSSVVPPPLVPPGPGASTGCWQHSVERSPHAWHKCTKWGLGWYLGFDDKMRVDSQKANPDDITFGWLGAAPSSQPCASDPSCCDAWIKKGENYLGAPWPAATRILGDTAFYIEVDKYNAYDELSPDTDNTASMFNRSGSGRVNSAFAKVSLTSDFGTRIIDPDQQDFQNVVQFEPPLERIRKLKFRIRHHDGRLVDFRGAPFDMSIEFIQLRDEIRRKMHIRVPSMYH
jgi:hypothetical protein